jgi:hypothetical protein
MARCSTLNRRRSSRLLTALAAAGACATACDGSGDAANRAAGDTPGSAAGETSKPDRSGTSGTGTAVAPRDILHTDLALDLTARRGRATVTLARGSGPATFDVGDLRIEAVRDPEGASVPFTRLAPGRVEVAVPTAKTDVVFEYGFSKHGRFDGWDATPGLTFLWPAYCGNLFPCHSDPADGTTFELAVAGVPEGSVAVYPAEIPAPAPAYQIGLAVGDYTYERLGETSAGTEVGLYTQPGGAETARTGAASLVGHFDWLETTLGPYLFGPKAASVAVDWGPGDFGGLEHHPYWHIDDGQMGDANTHAHEAAHGWFGGGVRLACWEDLVLSEGTVTYLAARAIEAVDGPDAGAEQWATYERELAELVEGGDDTPAWLPETCNAIDLTTHPLWSLVTYYKGALFLRAVEEAVGREALDAALAGFYRRHGGKSAARVQDLLNALEAATGLDPRPLAERWLLSKGLPAD